ncbi:MAG: hypothetical protein LBP35_02235 [Candidatus Ancillula trichonymphae]|jgi:hypothetical protein|nr:hypothetical protein [Candidatus Ancillula trichonymphae]
MTPLANTPEGSNNLGNDPAGEVPLPTCPSKSSNAPDIFYHSTSTDGFGRLFIMTTDSCGNPVPANVSDGYWKFYDNYMWDNFNWTQRGGGHLHYSGALC